MGGQAAHRCAHRRPLASSSRTSARSISASCSSASSERRLTMVRFELGSPIGGYADCCRCRVERERISVIRAALTGLLVVSVAACALAPEATSSATLRFHHRPTLARRTDGCVDRRQGRDGSRRVANLRRRGRGDSSCSRLKSIWSAAIFRMPRPSCTNRRRRCRLLGLRRSTATFKGNSRFCAATPAEASAILDDAWRLADGIVGVRRASRHRCDEGSGAHRPAQVGRG